METPGIQQVWTLFGPSTQEVRSSSSNSLCPTGRKCTRKRGSKTPACTKKYLESPRPFKNGSMTPSFWVIIPCLQGHGDSRYGISFAQKVAWLIFRTSRRSWTSVRPARVHVGGYHQDCCGHALDAEFSDINTHTHKR